MILMPGTQSIIAAKKNYVKIKLLAKESKNIFIFSKLNCSLLSQYCINRWRLLSFTKGTIVTPTFLTRIFYMLPKKKDDSKLGANNGGWL